MFFALDDDQREFDAAVRTFLAQRFALDAVRAVVEAPDSDGHPAALWKAAAEQGWLAVTVPEEHDGLGLGLLEAQVIARALGAGAAPGPWRGTVLAAEAVRLAGSDDQKATWLPRLASGDAVGAFTLRGSAPGALPAVEYGAVADVVVAPAGGGLALVTGATATPRRKQLPVDGGWTSVQADGTASVAPVRSAWTGCCGSTPRQCAEREPRSTGPASTQW